MFLSLHVIKTHATQAQQDQLQRTGAMHAEWQPLELQCMHDASDTDLLQQS